VGKSFDFEVGKSWNVKLFVEDINQSDVYRSAPYVDKEANWQTERLYFDKPEDTNSGFYEMEYGYELREEGCFSITLNSYSSIFNDREFWEPFCYEADKLGTYFENGDWGDYDGVERWADGHYINNTDNVGAFNSRQDVLVTVTWRNEAYVNPIQGPGGDDGGDEGEEEDYQPGLEVNSITINNEIFDWNALCCVGEYNDRQISFVNDDNPRVLDFSTDVQILDTEKDLNIQWKLSNGFPIVPRTMGRVTRPENFSQYLCYSVLDPLLEEAGKTLQTILKDIDVDDDGIPDRNITYEAPDGRRVYKNISSRSFAYDSIPTPAEIAEAGVGSLDILFEADHFAFDQYNDLDENIDSNQDGQADRNITINFETEDPNRIQLSPNNLIFYNIDSIQRTEQEILDNILLPTWNRILDENHPQYGEISLINHDVNFDGVPDINLDTNRDGAADTRIDLNGDCIPDEGASAGKVNVFEGQDVSINLERFYPRHTYIFEGSFCMKDDEGSCDPYKVQVYYNPNIEERPADVVQVMANGIPYYERVVSAGSIIEYTAQIDDPNNLENEIRWCVKGRKCTDWLSEYEPLSVMFLPEDIGLNFDISFSIRNNDGVTDSWVEGNGWENGGPYEVDSSYQIQFQVGE
jgi:hypothetical protein